MSQTEPGRCVYGTCPNVGPRCQWSQCSEHCHKHHTQNHQFPHELGKYEPGEATLIAQTVGF